MNAQPRPAQAPEWAGASVDDRNPWLGLASFTEETRAYFHGREDEVAELARRVQRKLLTVLFGQSGLGKTSILHAGLVPRLRSQGYCPIYLRIDYGRDAPEPAEQLKQAITSAARAAGEWTRSGVAVAGESLWEFLHHRDDVLRDNSGATLTPLLIFDQFEEIFTLAQSDDLGRARAARFIEELADLVENRAPKAFEARLELDESGAQQFDFTRSDYRVLITLREDYLAPLESLKKAMPSISQNRLRLAPMTGAQALLAVMQPGKGLVTEEVAEAIVRFVAGGAELANAEVEPSLLSLICRELNDARIAQGREEISLDLLAGSHATILSNFYERALADQPPAVRRIIEDDLLTSSGFRENVAEERLLSHFTAAGAAPDTLARLVNRRLLRIEERLDVRRVELTHDVLCGVVKASRDLRLESEARAATERLLAEQRERELAARRALVRARQVATVCVLLALGAVVAAGFAYVSSQRAHRAEQLAEQARSGAEHLLGYLTDDFVRELESFGRLNVVAEFSKRQIDYFHALPPALKGPETTRNGALAMIHYARAERILGDIKAATANATEAGKLLERLRAQADQSEATTIALALGYATQAVILDNQNDPTGPVAGQRAADLLRPLAAAPGASVAVRRAFVEVLVRRGYEELNGLQNADAIRTEEQAMQLATGLGARDLSNLEMGAYYVEAGAWLVPALVNMGRNVEARRRGEDAVALADKVLEQRPGYRLALHGQQVIESSLSNVAQNELDPMEAYRLGLRTEQTSLSILKLDPDNIVTINNLGVAHQTLGDSLWGAGKLGAAIPYYLKSLDDYGHATVGGAGFSIIRAYDVAATAYRQAQVGDAAGAAATIASGAPFLARLRQKDPQATVALAIVDALGKMSSAGATLERDEFAATGRFASAASDQLRAITPNGNLEVSQRSISLFFSQHLAGRAAFQTGDYAAAEDAEREALAARKVWGTEAIPDQRDIGEVSTWLAMALARQGKTKEAAQLIGPVVKFQRGLAARNRSDQWLPVELASALYAQALTDPKQRTALLQEAATLLGAAPAPLRNLHDVRQWRNLIAAARGAG
ncbi:MAG TPA: hypothetical protein VK505_09255 [Steroidobacteraceae bacterium]|nr:hypothetical protein [Steroidobacteraceae bacterium]